MQLNFIVTLSLWTWGNKWHIIGGKPHDATKYDKPVLYSCGIKQNHYVGIMYECSSLLLLLLQGFGGQLLSSPYLSTTEEPIENCSIIETIITEEVNQTDFKDYIHSKQSSRDSGNYSNDDTSGSKVSEETLEKEIV